MKSNLEKLRDLVDTLPELYAVLCWTVLDDPRFLESPASAGHHPGPHQAEGGLVLHTLEVAQHAIALARPHVGLANRALLAAVFHDYGKIHEYALTPDGVTKLPFHARIGHVAWSWAAFYEAAKGIISPEEIEDIGHAMLAHHGRREWGSPVEPQTRLAYILHTADMLSSRGIQ